VEIGANDYIPDRENFHAVLAGSFVTRKDEEKMQHEKVYFFHGAVA
jgi:hypothetical protein